MSSATMAAPGEPDPPPSGPLEPGPAGIDRRVRDIAGGRLPAGKAGLPADTALSAESAPATLRREQRLLVRIARDFGWPLVLVFVTLLLPLWGFSELAGELRAGAIFGFDEPILRGLRAMASAGVDRFFVLFSNLGYMYGVVPVDIALVAVLFIRRHLRAATFASMAVVGSALLNLSAKRIFTRDRPSLWESITPEVTWSFPSGHAMGSATLAAVVIVLVWHTRWRWPAIAAMSAFVLLVGISRMYLGVHYPSDILAGWAVASAWTAACHLGVYRLHAPTWPSHGQRMG
ncbi:phosphatase PAP2 family protein [Lysobacter sp. A03]|uniref:phosphatase PAP2 family protein n=1 Tax=Lysobacter sp. A03 TaxID=1199154 RepID=UPI001F20E3BD|nr:phosphatase PAP2 family protein [Lysobacter sp. A03]